MENLSSCSSFWSGCRFFLLHSASVQFSTKSLYQQWDEVKSATCFMWQNLYSDFDLVSIINDMWPPSVCSNHCTNGQVIIMHESPQLNLQLLGKVQIHIWAPHPHSIKHTILTGSRIWMSSSQGNREKGNDKYNWNHLLPKLCSSSISIDRGKLAKRLMSDTQERLQETSHTADDIFLDSGPYII